MTVRKIISLGKYSAVVSLPKEMLEKLRWRKGQKVIISSKGKTVKIRDFKNW